MKKLVFAFLIVAALIACKDEKKGIEKEVVLENSDSLYYAESFRPQYHFSPKEKWMNDPNGMVFHKGIYHLFYQYYPDDIVWGPMHWGHAISKDLIHWEHKPIALYPDELGYIFSGSAVVDKNNTSGFGSDETPPLVAIYTYHDIEGEKAGREDYQTQGIAYSLDNGDSWAKFEDNPVIGNDGIKDFRDPKVMWHEPTKSWLMTLVAGDHAQFYVSKDLKKWKMTGEFGRNKGAHGGVWECPDLFKLKVDGYDEEKWVLLISINPGAPNGGSGTQYFIGDFDGEKFTTDQSEIKWLDWGTDNYAGVTYSNEPNDERIFIGWMSNWSYALDTPTEKWRSAMTLPRKLDLQKTVMGYQLINNPIRNLEKIIARTSKKNIALPRSSREIIEFKDLSQSEVRFTTTSKDFEIKYGNSEGDEIILTMFEEEQEFFLDRTNSGKVDFQEDFAGVLQMPVPNLPNSEYEVRILMDQSSIEVFINEGQYVMTSQLFPNEPHDTLIIENLGDDEVLMKDFEMGAVKRIW